MKYVYYLPTSVTVQYKTMSRDFKLNLNSYKYLKGHTLGAIKDSFKPIEIPSVDYKSFKANIITINYTFYYTRSNVDIMNVVSIVDKNFQDWLVRQGYIPDDNVRHVVGVSMQPKRTQKKQCVKAEITIME